MTRILERVEDPETASAVTELLTGDLGYTPEEAIPIAIKAVFVLAALTPNPDQALDEASDMLAEPIGEEEEETLEEIPINELAEVA